ncbi:MAG: protein kinase [Planctomycetes bacterium]|nr:protein kinase [Planctomycetota bacterium]
MADPPRDPAEEAFAEFLDRVEAGEAADFEAVCAAHPAHAAALRRMHQRWLAMTRAFGEIAETTAPPPSPSVEALLQRLGAGAPRSDRYALGAEIARGGMGRIVQAWDQELRREVALKLQRSEPDDARAQRRFLEEAQIAAQLEHPGIVPIHELGLDADGRPFFSMQLVRGLDLGRVLERVREGDSEWSRTRVLHVLLRAGEAVAFAHSKGVVHRDLKPANIMVGRFHETYVMDWGLARAGDSTDRGLAGPDAAATDAGVASLRGAIAGEDADSPLLTRSGDVVGTPAYMAPEQAAGAATDARVDVYALGAILYHLLAGHMPYAEGGAVDADTILRRLAAGPPAPLPDDVPPELRAICERAMARAPDDRYPGMAALGDDLRSFLELRTVRAYATGRFAELQKWLARNRALAGSCLALLLALLAGAATATALWMQAEADRQRADASAAQLLTELDRSAFRSARLALQLDNSGDAADSLWRAHLQGRMPRATAWALRELAERDPYLVTLPLHEDLLPLAFAGSETLLVGAPDGRLQLREATTLLLRRELGETGPGLAAVAALDDAGQAVAGDRNGDLHWFDLAAGRRTARRAAHPGGVRQLLATGGSSFASGGADGRVLLWSDPAAEPRLLLAFPAAVTALALGPAGLGLVAADEQGEVAAATLAGDESFRRRVAGRQVMALVHGAEAHELWVGSTDHTIRRIWLDDREPDRIVPTRNGSCRQLARDADGSLLASGWWRIDRLRAGADRPEPVALRGAMRMAPHPERRVLATSGATSGLGLLDLGAPHRRWLPGTGPTLADDGRTAATLVGDQAVVHDIAEGRVVARVPAARGALLQLSPAGDRLAIATLAPSRLRIVDMATGIEAWAMDGPTEQAFLEACHWSPDGREVVGRTGSDRIERRDAATGALIAAYERPGASWLRVCHSADGRWLAAIRRRSSTVLRVDLATGQQTEVEFVVERPGQLAGSVSAVALSADGSRLAVGTWQGQVLLRRADGTTDEIAAHGGTIWSLCFADDDDGLLFTAGGAQGIAAWDLDTLECCFQAVRDQATRLQLSRDGNTLACQTPDGPLVVDLAYRQRHVAGNLEFQFDRQRRKVAIPPARERELRQWLAAEQSRPWPRWR